MHDFDLLIRGAEPHPAIGVAGEMIVALAEGSAREEIDASGLLVLPGVIDSHVHFNEPGREAWEGIATGSRACAAGGTTTFFDMPLNAHPPTCDAASFDLKRAAMERSSSVDFGLWGGLVPGNVDEIEALRDRGVIGLKAFLCPSGIDDFPDVDRATLRAGMARAAALRMIVAVHAEIDHHEFRRGTSIRDYLSSRPVAIELEAISVALELAHATGCALHIVHVSSGAGVRLVAEAVLAGIDVSCETCPHYLVLNEADAERIGPLAKCAPPLRDEAERCALFSRLEAGQVLTIGSDHSPAPMSMKSDPDFFKVWGGISGCQHLLALLLDLGLGAERIRAVAAENVADRFGISSRKGRIAPGFDADLVLVDRRGVTEISADSLQYRHRHSPYLGRMLRGRVVRTILRGKTIAIDGRLVSSASGRLVKPVSN
jgi:allantoinase